MAAHGRELEDVFVGQVLSLALEPERVADTVPAQIRCVTALLGAIDRGRDVDAETKIGFLNSLDEVLGSRAIVEHSSRGGGCIVARDHSVKVRSHFALPMRERIHRPGRTERAAMTGVPEVDRMEPARDLQKLFQLGDGVFVILAPAGNGEYHVIVAKT